MIVIAPLFGIAQMVYYFGIAEYLLGVEKNKKKWEEQGKSSQVY